MGHRQFRDSTSTLWDVWEVEPSRAERRIAARDRRQSQRPGPDRRQRDDPMPRARISTEFVLGWLAFQSAHEKRRLAPVPNGWEGLDDASLERLLLQAVPVGRPRRLIE